MPSIREILAKKRDGEALSDAEVTSLIGGIGDGSVSDAQIAAFAMAVVINGMDKDETVSLTRAMRDSGAVMRWPSLPGPVLDKHSSGGIGDKISLILAPLLAACGAFVPMISGRGLGHTGGTLDKLESLDGYQVQVDEATLKTCIQRAGCAIVGATDAIAPADKRIYAVRDVTATVESLPLITASILSKKLAASPDALIMDVKVGSGAFCQNMEEATALAQSIAEVANGAGLPAAALITDMNQCLGTTAGNALELREALDILQGKLGETRLSELTTILATELLALGGQDVNDAGRLVGRALASGSAYERFEKMAFELGCSHIALGDAAPVQLDVIAAEPGIVQAVDARALGMAVIDLGGGRLQPQDQIDHSAGLDRVAAIGTRIDGHTPLARIHAKSMSDARRASVQIRNAYTIGDTPTGPPPLIHARIKP